MILKFIIPGKPHAKQSFRFTKKGIKYQTEEIKVLESNTKALLYNQLPKDFEIIKNKPILMIIEHSYELPKSYPKNMHKQIESGTIIFKTTVPDVTDNLNKGIIDGMKSMIISDDSIISWFTAYKVYSKKAQTLVTVATLDEPNHIIRELIREMEDRCF